MLNALLSIIYRILVKLFAPRPSVKFEGHNLVIRSGWRTVLFTLGGRSRRVVVDRNLSRITIKDRRFWLFTSSQIIVFERVHEVVYGFIEFGNFLSSEIYSVGLWLKDGKVITLFRLFAEGEIVNNSFLPDFLFWEETVPSQIVQHSMDDHTLSVTSVLAATIGVPVGCGPE